MINTIGMPDIGFIKQLAQWITQAITWLLPVAILGVLAVILWILWLSRAPRTSATAKPKWDEINWGRAIISIIKYAEEHRFVFVAIMSLMFLWLAIFTLLLFSLDDPNKPGAIQGLASSIFTGLLTALLILVMTDYASKQYFVRILEDIEPKLREVVSNGQEAAKIFAETGLRVYPSIQKMERPATGEFKSHLKDGETLRVMSHTGMRWLNNTTDGNPWETNLSYLVRRPVAVEIIIFSPLLYLDRLLRYNSGSSPTVDAFFAALKTEPFKNIMHSPFEILTFHHEAITRILNPHGSFTGSDQNFKLDVRVSGFLFMSEFFVIGDKRAYGAYSMVTARSLDSIGVHVYDPPSTAENNLVDKFQSEFNHFWDISMPFEKYVRDYDVTIIEILKKQIGDRSYLPVTKYEV